MTFLKKIEKRLNSHISQTRKNAESKLKFSESSFNFLENNVIVCTRNILGLLRYGAPLQGVPSSVEFAVIYLFLLKISWNFQYTAIFHLWGKQYLYLVCSVLNTLKNWHLKKKQEKLSLNGHISKPRLNSESKLKFCESSFSYFKKSVIFNMLYQCRYAAGGSASYNPRHNRLWITGSKGLTNPERCLSWFLFFAVFGNVKNIFKGDYVWIKQGLSKLSLI